MMLNIYYREEDKWLVDKVDHICLSERKSRSAVILSILEDCFERGKKIGQIFQDVGLVSFEQLQDALKLQESKKKGKHLGQILKAQGIVTERHIQKALALQGKGTN